MHKKLQLLITATLLPLACAVFAQKPIVYPSKGQSAAQQNKDDGECYVWAKQNTGYDPANPPAQAGAAQPAAPMRQGGVLRGAAAGAVVGAVGDNDVGNAAAKGAVIGGVAQRARHRGQQEAANQQAQAGQQQQAAANDTYQRAYSACMSGRGYTVN
ncbi:MAG: hypothetical protein ABW049_11845 [Spongiibacteraceae bacterium]